MSTVIARPIVIVALSWVAVGGCNAVFGVDGYEASTTTATATTTTTTTTSSSALPSCSNGISDGDETGVDCGGSCPPCALLEPLGAKCETADQCQSGFCPPQDGVCCDTTCELICEACAASKTGSDDGVCDFVDPEIEADPDDECDATSESSCGSDGSGCSGELTACRLWIDSTVCNPESCVGATLTAASLCDGAGSCVVGLNTSCAPYVCESSSASCRTNCTNQTHCSAGNYCRTTSGTCHAKLSFGSPCNFGYECLSGVCMLNVCS